jgi:hypothetical protein
VTLIALSVTVRLCADPGSRIANVCDSPACDGNSPAFSVSTLAWSFALTRSTPSTASSRAPRSSLTFAAVAGEFGSV